MINSHAFMHKMVLHFGGRAKHCFHDIGIMSNNHNQQTKEWPLSILSSHMVQYNWVLYASGSDKVET